MPTEQRAITDDSLAALERRTLRLEQREAAVLDRLAVLERAVAVPTPPTVPQPAPTRVKAAVAPVRQSRAADPAGLTPTPAAGPAVPANAPAPAAPATPAPARKALAPPRLPAAEPPTPRRTAAELADLVGGHVLGWVGGLAVFVGVLLLLAVAIAHGWLGPVGRTFLALVGGLALLAAGAWLHERRGRTNAARIAVGSAIASLFATLVVATKVYDLVPAPVGLVLAFAVGAVAAVLAIRWTAPPIAALGIVGALLAPVLVGAAPSGVTVAFVFIAASAAVVVCTWQRWSWLRFAVFACSLPQWALWLGPSRGVAPTVLVLVAFGLLGFAGGAGYEVRVRALTLSASALVLVVANALVLAVVGWYALGGGVGGQVWVGALAAAHLLAGSRRARLVPENAELRHCLLALGALLADVAFATAANGVVLGLGWAAAAAACALVLGRAQSSAVRFDRPLLGIGLGAHVSFVLVRALELAPPSDLGGRGVALVPMIAVLTLAALSFSAARLLPPTARPARRALDALGLLTFAYLSALVFGGAQLVAVWAFESVVLAELARRDGDGDALVAALAFLAAAVLLTLVSVANPARVPWGAAGLQGATLAVAAVGLAGVRTSVALRAHARLRAVLLALAVLALGYASALLVGGVALVGVWAVEAVLLGELARRRRDDVLTAGALALLAGSVAFTVAALATLTLAVAIVMIASTRLAFALARHARWRAALFGLAQVALAYESALLLGGAALAVAWVVEAVVLGELARWRRDDVLAAGALAFLTGAGALATVVLAPPSGLVYGVSRLGAATIALVACALGCARMAALCPALPRRLGARELDDAARRRLLLAAAGLTGLYLASVAIITASQPAAGAAAADLLDLGVREEGQVLLSVLWSAVGFAGSSSGCAVATRRCAPPRSRCCCSRRPRSSSTTCQYSIRCIELSRSSPSACSCSPAPTPGSACGRAAARGQATSCSGPSAIEPRSTSRARAPTAPTLAAMSLRVFMRTPVGRVAVMIGRDPRSEARAAWEPPESPARVRAFPGRGCARGS